MTNRFILRRYICGLLARLRNSQDISDKEIYRYLAKKFTKLPGVDNEIRQMGEIPHIHWKHNSNPDKIRGIVKDANRRKTDAGYARRIILSHVTS